MAFKDVDNPWADKTCCLTTLTTDFYSYFIDKDYFCKSTTQSHTPSQNQSPSHAAKPRRFSQQWDQNIGTKDTIFTASAPTRLNVYNDVVD